MSVSANKVATPPSTSEVLAAESVKPQKKEVYSFVETVVTTLSVYGVFLLQGIVIARILGPHGRGEFGHALYFARDILLYAGLLGAMEVVNSIASKRGAETIPLKYAAARLGILTGVMTGLVAAILSICFLISVQKTYLIPYCLIVCLFVPWEHMQLTISAVDRGIQAYRAYNINRLIYSAAFLVFVVAAFGLDEIVATTTMLPNSVAEMCERFTGFNHMVPCSGLMLMCILLVAARIIGLIPTLRGMKVWERLKSGRSQSKTVKSELNPWQLLKSGRFYALSTLATECFDRLDIFLIMVWATMDTAGNYFVAVPAAALLTIAPNSLAVFTFNVGADESRSVTLKQALAAMGLTAAFQVIATLVFVLILPSLILWFYGSAFHDAIEFAMWLLPACAMKGYLQAADGYLKGCGKPMLGVWARLVSIVAMVVFVWFAFPSWNLISIPMAACLGQAISVCVVSVGVINDVSSRSTTKLEGAA